MTQSYRAPVLPSNQVTTELVRDELLRCFESANREFATLMNQPVTDQELKSQVKQFVEGVFSQCGVNYVNPTKAGIQLAIDQCKTNAAQMMGPKGAEVINHHYHEMMKLVNQLPD